MDTIYRLACEYCFFVISTSGEQKGRSEGKLQKEGDSWGEGWGIKGRTMRGHSRKMVERGDDEEF